MAERPGCVGATCGVAGVGGGGCVALQDGCRERAIVYFSGEAAVALAAKFAVPSGGGHPDFDFYVGIWRGFVFGGYSAKGGELFVEGRIAGQPGRCRLWRGKCSCGDDLGGGDGRVWQG